MFGRVGTQTYGGRGLSGTNSWDTTLPMLGYCRAGLGRYPVNMLCVPRSCAASPCVIERTTVILSAIFAMFGTFSLKTSPFSAVGTVPNGPRYSIGAYGLGSNDSCCAIPPGRKMWMIDLATPSLDS